MTVYRRRLTSSFYAIQRSLERRLEYLEGRDPKGLAHRTTTWTRRDLEADVTETACCFDDGR